MKHDEMLTDANMLALLMLLAPASAFYPAFHFAKHPQVFSQSDETCKMCYGEFDCVVMDKARCEYNAATAAVFNDHEDKGFTNNRLKMEVDSMMHDLILNESINEQYKECIPFISSYTDCDRENICTGCNTCECDMKGKWNCSLVQQCHQEGVKVDHRVLVIVMESFKSDPTFLRIKRSNKESQNIRNPHKISHEKLAEWMYGTNLVLKKKAKNLSNKIEVLQELNMMEEITNDTSTTPIIDPAVTDDTPKNLAFDDVLREIGLTEKINTSANDPIKIEEKHKADSSTDQFLEMLAAEEDIMEPTLHETTKVSIDLLNESDNLVMDTGNFVKNDVKDKLNKLANRANNIDFIKEMDNMSYFNFVNVKKRGVSKIPSMSTTVQTITTESATHNMTILEKAMIDDILDPVTELIKEKNKEIEQLIKIRDSLMKFMKVFKFNSTFYNESKIYENSLNFTTNQDDNSQMYNYYRRKYGNGNVVILNKFVNKLKWDINEVIKDIIGIKRYQNSNVLSKDLKILLQAIRHYMKNNKFEPRNNIITNKRFGGPKIRNKNPRRQLQPSNVNYNINIKETLLKMLEVIDKDMPISNALSPLSPRTKKIFKRVVNKNYVDHFLAHDPHYNMTSDLNSIGIRWHEITANLLSSSPADRLYNIEFLYFTLSYEIIKIMDALAFLEFYNNRRMTGIKENTIEIHIILDRIYTNLRTIAKDIKSYIHSENIIAIPRENKNRKQKKSLLKKIKSLFTNSKIDLINFLQKKRTPSQDSEHKSRKIMEDAEIQNSLGVMQKWQNNLDVIPRNKRSVREYTKKMNRIKNIIPQYLRGKLNPALNAKGKGIKKIVQKNNMELENKASTYSNKMIVTTTAKAVANAVRVRKIKRRH